MNFDEFLKEAGNQAEFDKRVAKALETAKKTWDEDAKKAAEEEKKRLEEEAKLSAEEKTKKEIEKLMKENGELKASQAKREMSDKALAHIKEKGYDSAIADLIDLSSFADDADMAKRLEDINTKYTNKVSDSLNAKLKENGYSDLAGKGGDGGNKDTFNFGFTPIK